MSTGIGSNKYDLEERTEEFALHSRKYCNLLLKANALKDDCWQLVRSSGSVAANYIEANESLSKKDFYYRIKICRKEAKESRLWLRLLQDVAGDGNKTGEKLIQEATELMKIFGAIVRRSK